MRTFRLSLNARVKLADLQEKTCGYKDMLALDLKFLGDDLIEVLECLFALKSKLRELWFEHRDQRVLAVEQTKEVLIGAEFYFIEIGDCVEDEIREWDEDLQNFPYRCIWESPADSAIDIMINDLLENYGTERE